MAKTTLLIRAKTSRPLAFSRTPTLMDKHNKIRSEFEGDSMGFNITIIRASLPLLKEYINQRGFLSLVVEHIIIINFTQPSHEKLEILESK